MVIDDTRGRSLWARSESSEPKEMQAVRQTAAVAREVMRMFFRLLIKRIILIRHGLHRLHGAFVTVKSAKSVPKI